MSQASQATPLAPWALPVIGRAIGTSQELTSTMHAGTSLVAHAPVRERKGGRTDAMEDGEHRQNRQGFPVY